MAVTLYAQLAYCESALAGSRPLPTSCTLAILGRAHTGSLARLAANLPGRAPPLPVARYALSVRRDKASGRCVKTIWRLQAGSAGPESIRRTGEEKKLAQLALICIWAGDLWAPIVVSVAPFCLPFFARFAHLTSKLGEPQRYLELCCMLSRTRHRPAGMISSTSLGQTMSRNNEATHKSRSAAGLAGRN